MNEPIETPSPKVEKTAGFLTKMNKVVAVVAIIVVVMIFFGRKTLMGKRYKVSEVESVNYSGAATEEQAKQLGDALKSVGYFSGSKEIDVLFKKEDSGESIISFVLNGRWDDEEIVAAFHEIGAAIADQGLGRPLTIKLLDDHLNTENEFKIE